MRSIEQRVGLLFALFLLVFSVVLARAVWLQGVRGGAGPKRAASRPRRWSFPGCGARSSTAADVSWRSRSRRRLRYPFQIDDPADAAQRLAEVLDTPEDEILDAISDRNSIRLCRRGKVDLSTAEQIRKLKIEGIGQLPDSRRVYPDGELASQVGAGSRTRASAGSRRCTTTCSAGPTARPR